MSERVYTPAEIAEMSAIDPGAAARAAAEGAAAYMKYMKPGRQPLPYFEQACRLGVATTVEVVAIREQEQGPEVWLERRSENDRWWAGKYALSGTVILGSDIQDEEKTLSGPVNRLFRDELTGITPVGELHQLPAQFRHDGRGNEVTNQFWTLVETGDEPYAGGFYNLEQLPLSEIGRHVLGETWLTLNRVVAHPAFPAEIPGYPVTHLG